MYSKVLNFVHLRVHIYDILYFFILNKLVADRFKKFQKMLQKIISTSENNKKIYNIWVNRKEIFNSVKASQEDLVTRLWGEIYLYF